MSRDFTDSERATCIGWLARCASELTASEIADLLPMWAHPSLTDEQRDEAFERYREAQSVADDQAGVKYLRLLVSGQVLTHQKAS